MKIVIPIYEGDVDAAIDNAKLIEELGGAKGHTALVVASDSVLVPQTDVLTEALSKSFDKVDLKVVAINERKDPNLGANHLFTPQQNQLFKACIQALVDIGNSGPWLYMEADTTPIAKDWIQVLEEEFSKAAVAGKQIVGSLIPLRKPRYALVPGKFGPVRSMVDLVADTKHEYIPAPAIFAAGFASTFQVWKTAKLDPWDIKSRVEFEPYYYNTKAIFQAHNSKGYTPELEFERFSTDKTGAPTKVPSGAVLVHGCRDGSLAKTVRAAMKQEAVKKQEPKAEPKTETKSKVEEPKPRQSGAVDVESARRAALAARK